MAYMRVDTESGSRYVFQGDEVRRQAGPVASELRLDQQPVPVVEWPEPEMGEPMVMLLDVRGDGVLTIRTTTAVTAIDYGIVEDEDSSSGWLRCGAHCELEAVRPGKAQCDPCEASQ